MIPFSLKIAAITNWWNTMIARKLMKLYFEMIIPGFRPGEKDEK